MRREPLCPSLACSARAGHASSCAMNRCVPRSLAPHVLAVGAWAGAGRAACWPPSGSAKPLQSTRRACARATASARTARRETALRAQLDKERRRL
eukprot:948770-Prymnesium_polylepis.1